MAVALVLSVLAAEGLARWIFRDVTTTSSFRGFFTTRWIRSAVRHNHYGFRGDEFEEIKPPRTFRVAVIGDSFTYGNGIPEDSRFSDLLHARLSARGVEVLNFGFPGNNWPQHLEVLERRVLRLRPDFVLLQWGINDVERDQDVSSRPRLRPLFSNPALHDWLYARSALYTLVDAQSLRMQLTQSMGDPYAAYMQRMYKDPRSLGALDASRHLERFVQLARGRNADVGMVLIPDPGHSLGDDYPFTFLHERTLADCAKAGIPCVDLLPVYRKVPNRRDLWASPLDPHPSMLANQIAATEITSAFSQAWTRQ